MLGTLAALLEAGVSDIVLGPPLEERRSSVEPHKSLGEGSQDYYRSKLAKSKLFETDFEADILQLRVELTSENTRVLPIKINSGALCSDERNVTLRRKLLQKDLRCLGREL